MYGSYGNYKVTGNCIEVESLYIALLVGVCIRVFWLFFLRLIEVISLCEFNKGFNYWHNLVAVLKCLLHNSQIVFLHVCEFHTLNKLLVLLCKLDQLNQVFHRVVAANVHVHDFTCIYEFWHCWSGGPPLHEMTAKDNSLFANETMSAGESSHLCSCSYN